VLAEQGNSVEYGFVFISCIMQCETNSLVIVVKGCFISLCYIVPFKFIG